MNWAILEVLILGWNNLQKMFINSFKKNHGPLIASAISTLIYPLWCYIFIIRLDLGAVGSSLANLASALFMYIFNLTFTYMQEDMALTNVTPTLEMLRFENLKEQF